MRLFGVELDRFRSRRAIVLTLLAAVVLAVVMVGSALWDTRPVTEFEQAAAEKQAAQDADRKYVQRDYRRCLEDPGNFMGPGATADDCEQMLPQPEWYLSRQPLDIERQLEERGTALMYLLLGISIIVGTTFVGADWATGSMANQLLFEPRRLRVWAAKAAAAVAGVAGFAALLLAAFWAVLLAVAHSRGITTPSEVQSDVLTTSLRGVVLAGGGALGSYALTMLFRHTVGTLALLLGYAVAGETLAATLPFDKMSQWALSHNVEAWLNHGTRVYDESICTDITDGSCDPTYLLTLSHAVWFLGLMLLVAAVVSVLSFRRRDV